MKNYESFKNKTFLFGQHLQHLRQEKNLTQEQLAELSTLHRTYIGDLENGRRNPSLITLIKISNALNLNLSDFFKGYEIE